MENQIQFDCYGHHRLKVGDSIGRPSLYEFPAVLEKDGEFYVAFSPYYDGNIPTEKLFKLVPVESECLNSMDMPCNFFRPDEPCSHMEVRAR